MLKENLGKYNKDFNMPAKKFFVCIIYSATLLCASIQCSEPAREEALIPLQKILTKSPKEMHEFISWYSVMNPRTVFGLTKPFTSEELEDAYDQLKKQFDPIAMENSEDAEIADIGYALYITEMLQKAHSILTISAVPKLPQAQARETALFESETGLELVPIAFYNRGNIALSSNQPWVGLGIPKSSSKDVVNRTYKKLAAYYSPEQLQNNPDTEWRGSVEIQSIHQLLIELRDAMPAFSPYKRPSPYTTSVKELTPQEEPEILFPINEDLMENNSPSSLLELIRGVGQEQPWIIFGIDKNTNARTVNAAFHQLAKKYSPFFIENDPASSEEDKKIAPELHAELIKLRTNMLGNMPKKQAPHTTAIGLIKTTRLSPAQFYENAKRDLRANMAHRSLGIDQRANVVTINAAHDKLVQYFNPKTIKNSRRSTDEDKKVANKIGRCVQDLREQMLKNLEENSKE